MELFDENIDYGLGMWRYAVWITGGAIFAMAGPVATNMAVNSISGFGIGSSIQQILLLTGTVATQIAGAIIAGAGFFGGLYKVIKDAN